MMLRPDTIACALLLAAPLIAGCSKPDQGTGTGRSGLPGVYEAEFRHVDGSRTRMTVQIKTDSTFRMIVGELDRFAQADEYTDDVGHWELTGDDLVRMTGTAQAPHVFRTYRRGTLRIVNTLGEDPDPVNPRELVRISDETPTDIAPPPAAVQGMYSYMADAGRFYDCAIGEDFPVATAGDNATLESEYLKIRSTPNQRVYVRLEAYYRRQYSMGGNRLERTLVPIRLIGFDTTMRCR